MNFHISFLLMFSSYPLPVSSIYFFIRKQCSNHYVILPFYVFMELPILEFGYFALLSQYAAQLKSLKAATRIIFCRASTLYFLYFF